MSTLKVRRQTTYTLEHDGQEFELTFPPIENTETVKINRRKKTAEIRYLVQDDDCGIRDYWKENDNGRFYCADPRSSWHEALDDEAIEEMMKSHPGRVFFISKFEHSSVLFFRQAGQQGYPYNCPWDVSRNYAIYVAPEDAPDPAGYCDSVMKEFSAWCNGEVFGCALDKYKRDGDGWKLVDSDSCWGYIGFAWASEALKTFPN